MSIDKLLKEHDEWLKKAPQSFKLQAVKLDDTKLVRAATEQRIAEVDQRIAKLTEARDVAVKRYDEAIAAEKAELGRLKTELKNLPAAGATPGAGGVLKPG